MKIRLDPRHLSVCWLLAGGCVASSTYEATVRDRANAQAELVRTTGRHERATGELQRRLDSLQRELDSATAENAGLRAELERLGTDVDHLLADKGILATELAESRMRLQELRRARAAAEERAALYRDIAMRLRQMVDAGTLSVVLRDGRMVMQLPNEVLFDSGRTEVNPGGRVALLQVAEVLRTLEGRRFHVGGHTDDVPIATTRFPSNWELSMARGLSVLRVLVMEGVPQQMLAAEGFGEFDPVASNETTEGRAKNRRTEITLQPRVEELIGVPYDDFEVATLR